MVRDDASTIVFGWCLQVAGYRIVADDPSVFALPIQRVVQDRDYVGADRRLPNK